jgi:hypothetical protein
MSRGHSVRGLMKWLERDEWASAFDEVMDSHIQPACEATGVEVERVVSILGQDWFRASVWACAFEDFLTRTFEDGSNIVDDYLRRRGWKESASARAYMATLRTSVMSVYEVSDIVPETSFRARDLVRGGEPVLIHERLATRTLKQWDRIAARVIQIRGLTFISGAVLPLGRNASEKALSTLRKAEKILERKIRKADANANGSGDSSTTEVLRNAAPTITTAWLVDVIDRATHRPEIRNSDGDEIMFCTVRYPFAAGRAAGDIRAALAACPDLAQLNETVWNWLGPETARPKQNKMPTNAREIATYSPDGVIVLGTVELKDNTLLLSVNSQTRFERGRALVAEALGDLVGPPLTEMQTLDQFMAEEGQDAPSSAGPDITPEERRSIIHGTLDRHYRKLLDQPIPALGHKSPRAAVKSAKGRAKVVKWLKHLENTNAQCAGQDDDMATYDASWLWTELGLAELRR